METSNHPVSPLRQRMLEDMHMRKLAPKTQQSYIRAVSRFAKYLGRSPDTATAEDLRRYQLHLVDAGTSPITLNATITGLKFLFDVTLGHGDVLAKMQSIRVPRKIPVVLNKQEVSRLIACAGNLKHQTALAVAYGTGLRVNEVISLKVPAYHLVGGTKRLHRCGHAAVHRGVQEHLLNLGRCGAVVQRAAHMAFQFILFAQRGEHGHSDQAAGFQVQPRALPHIAPSGAGNVLLNGRGEGRGVGEGGLDKGLAHDLGARGEPLVKCFGMGRRDVLGVQAHWGGSIRALQQCPRW